MAPPFRQALLFYVFSGLPPSTSHTKPNPQFHIPFEFHNFTGYFAVLLTFFLVHVMARPYFVISFIRSINSLVASDIATFSPRKMGELHALAMRSAVYVTGG